MAEVNIAWAAMTVSGPGPAAGGLPGRDYARNGLTRSNAVTAKMSVEMPMTMPGTMMAM